MKVVSVILARGGSKGIPRKNLIDLKGYPLIYYTIKASLESNVSETWVSSDNDEILQTSQKFGAQILKRPSIWANDVASSEEALLHFAHSTEFDYLVFIQPTSPLLKAHDINKGLIKLNTCDSVFSGYEEHWTGKWDYDLKPIGWEIKTRPRRQDVNPTYVENGAFYITSKSNLLKSGLRYSGNIEIVLMPFNRSFQVDTLEDLELINKIL